MAMGDHGVTQAFDRGADRYDLLVSLNPGYHRHLRSAARMLAARLAGLGRPALVVDLGCGSGASTSALLTELPKDTDVIGIDASAGMLARAATKRWPGRVSFRQARAEDFAAVMAVRGQSVDGVLAAYLFRNLAAGQLDAALAGVVDALRPGGWLVVQDYALTSRRLPRWVWHLVCWLVVIPLSALVRSEPSLYRYLWRSVLRFDSAADFARRLERAGLEGVAFRTVPGWQHGILHTFVGRRPDRG
jgi:ubiquinone/menaquinone biosynthesis C-methylase UbiE